MSLLERLFGQNGPDITLIADSPIKKGGLVAGVYVVDIETGESTDLRAVEIDWIEMFDPQSMPLGMALHDAESGEEITVRVRGKRGDFSPLKD